MQGGERSHSERVSREEQRFLRPRSHTPILMFIVWEILEMTAPTVQLVCYQLNSSVVRA